MRHAIADPRTLRWLTAEVIGRRFRLENERRQTMSRLTDKLAQAQGVAQRATNRIEARADALIAREDSIRKREEDAFSPHEALLSEAERGLDAVERALGQMSNGDPLPDSGATGGAQEVPVPPPPFPAVQ